jgi:hypothetical protein
MVIISGDSWGCGEWPQRYSGPDEILHGGLAWYIRDSGQRVINLSQGGFSNQDILRSIHRFFISGTHLHLVETVQTIFVFQTEWYRDFSPATYCIDFDTNFLDPLNEDIHLRYLSRFYYGLSEISKKYSVSIKLIGGVEDTIWLDQFKQEYPGVEVVCQSFTNLCVNDDHRVNKENFSISSKAADFLKNRTDDPTMISFIESLIDNTLTRQQIWDANPEYFFPDGKHANQKGHKKLFDFLMQTKMIL